MKPDLYWIPGPWRGHLAISAKPRGGDWLEDEIYAWKTCGVNTVVSFLDEAEQDELDLTAEETIADRLRLGFISFPIPDRGLPPSRVRFLALLRELDTRLDDGQTIALHCRQGVGRSGMTAAALLIGSGIRRDEALAVVAAARGRDVPDTAEQREWLGSLSEDLAIPVAT